MFEVIYDRIKHGTISVFPMIRGEISESVYIDKLQETFPSLSDNDCSEILQQHACKIEEIIFFYETRQEQQPFSMEIPDDLLSDGLIKEKGYPLRGAGKVLGVDYRDGKLYVTFIITSNYYEHIRVECDSNGYYIPGGNIIFPPSWDTEERREHAVLKSRRFYTNRPSEQ